MPKRLIVAWAVPADDSPTRRSRLTSGLSDTRARQAWYPSPAILTVLPTAAASNSNTPSCPAISLTVWVSRTSLRWVGPVRQREHSHFHTFAHSPVMSDFSKADASRMYNIFITCASIYNAVRSEFEAAMAGSAPRSPSFFDRHRIIGTLPNSKSRFGVGRCGCSKTSAHDGPTTVMQGNR
jgi:hypothetical protein